MWVWPQVLPRGPSSVRTLPRQPRPPPLPEHRKRSQGCGGEEGWSSSGLGGGPSKGQLGSDPHVGALDVSSAELESTNALGAFRPQPRRWIKILDPWVHDFNPSIGLGFGTLTGRRRFVPVINTGLDSDFSCWSIESQALPNPSQSFPNPSQPFPTLPNPSPTLPQPFPSPSPTTPP